MLLATLKSKGFTILAAIDPQMHPPEELQVVLGVFDGEYVPMRKRRLKHQADTGLRDSSIRDSQTKR